MKFKQWDKVRWKEMYAEKKPCEMCGYTKNVRKRRLGVLKGHYICDMCVGLKQ